MAKRPAVDALPDLSVGDEVRLFFDSYRPQYDFTPDSPMETTVTDVESDRVTEDEPGQPGPLRSVEFAVVEDDPYADRYWMEYREYDDPDLDPSASFLLYERTLIGSVDSRGAVGNVADVEVVGDDRPD